jgi:endonuclease/exonuclease/phosphatase family metal-dependent hydrolase
MKRNSLRCLFLLVLLATAFGCAHGVHAVGESEETREVSIIAWNIEWYPGKRRFAVRDERWAHADLVKAELKRLDPDIFLAQEIRNWEAFGDLCDAVPGLRPVALSAFYGPLDGEYWDQQIGIGSRLPVMAAWSEPWQMGDVKPRRGFTAATIRIPRSLDLLLVYSLHLKSNLADDHEDRLLNYRMRDESIRQLLEHIRYMKETVFVDRIVGVIVGGDFNTNNDEQFGDNAIQMMIDAGFHHSWEGVPREERLTWRGSNRFQPSTLDHFFTKGVGEPIAELLEVADETSDHWPLRITIEIPH